MLSASTLRAIIALAVLIWAWSPLIRDDAEPASAGREIGDLKRKLRKALVVTIFVGVVLAGAQVVHDLPPTEQADGPTPL